LFSITSKTETAIVTRAHFNARRANSQLATVLMAGYGRDCCCPGQYGFDYCRPIKPWSFSWGRSP